MKTQEVSQIIDGARFTQFHWMVMCLCALLLVFDGYDLFIYGAVLPVLMKEWTLSPVQAGALGSYALFGMMFGAFIFGPLADRIGRKKGVAISFVLFSLSTFASGFASSPNEFGIFRFLAGLGCGGLMPNAVALMNEYAPKRLRSTLVAIMFSGYSLGGVLCAGLGIWMLPRFGWQSMFFAAAVPLVLLPLILWKLPESVGFLLRAGKQEQARAMLAQVAPHAAPGADVQLVQGEAKPSGAPMLELFKQDRTVGTLMIWIAFFCCLLMVYALGSWLPKLMASAGYSLGSSLSFLLALNFGGVVGAIGGGWLGDRFTLPKVVVSFFAVGTVAIALLGFNSPTPVLYLLIIVAGATTIGTQILLYANTAQFYPLAIRSTGLGWASGVGRSGAIVGPLLGGALMAAALPLSMNFLVFAIPGLVAALAFGIFLLRYRHGQRAVAAEATSTVSAATISRSV
ncbi:major facilitator superfamily benzoate permease [Herbaspirillum sp. GW103]|uniref:MFS transporter n=1 Tax=unclassified Herbaspirillum TaxID=2624150 RepID=UPI00025E352B|nr:MULTISPECIES: aromatic acid/H+ symport family MFS transporter [unclassified Herbaspirillum]EIJ48682.1 major facilitator superfamily benzoate permease [Herbaspirillum sp. GW103]MCI1007157.1 aromatic acid/H+ symport family MFS transporter [Herbaspirillum sp. C7C8]NUT62141.1 aromatic acid/H+ symport family MFS transporter [Herbaspirillum sp. C9C3]